MVGIREQWLLRNFGGNPFHREIEREREQTAELPISNSNVQVHAITSEVAHHVQERPGPSDAIISVFVILALHASTSTSVVDSTDEDLSRLPTSSSASTLLEIFARFRVLSLWINE